MLYISIFMAALTFISCRSTNPLSTTKDIGVFNTVDAKGQVIYTEGSVVYNKACDSSASLPYTRSCSSSQTPKQMDLAKYIGALPYDTGAFARDANGLSLISKAITDAQANHQDSVVQRLTPLKNNIQKILTIKDNLTSKVVLTVYDYQDDFTKLLAPFGGSSTQGSGSTTSGGVRVSSCSFKFMAKDGCLLSQMVYQTYSSARSITAPGGSMSMDEANAQIERDFDTLVPAQYAYEATGQGGSLYAREILAPTKSGSGLNSSWTYRYANLQMGSGPQCAETEKIWTIRTDTISCVLAK